MLPRDYYKTVPKMQEAVQGQNANRNSAGIKAVRGTRTVQPGNFIPRQVRRGGAPLHT